ncbi:MAG: GDP-mannose 4,6-dehydratase [Anaerolineae bacterium]|nr:GDP-mannose 4,6-dehydratase [Anaerolineae bacterium]
MQALITGISGFVGSHLADYLLSHTDWQIAGTLFGDATPIAHLRERVTLYPADLTRPEAARAVVEETQPDVIFHLAAQSLPALSRQDPWGTLETNLRGQLNILEAAALLRNTCRILIVGSSEEYGLVRPQDLPVSETTPLRPLTPYAVSKVAQEMLGLQYHLSRGLYVLLMRPFNHIGPRQRLGFVAADFAHQVAQAEAGLLSPVVAVGNLDVARDFTDVRDIVRAYYLAVVEGEPGQVYNLGSERAHTVRELLQHFIDLTGLRIEVREDAARKRRVDVPMIVSDCHKFRLRTGWQATIPFTQTLRDILDDWRTRVRQEAANPLPARAE